MALNPTPATCDCRRTSAGALAAWQRGLMLRLLRVDVERRLRPARN
jgi:hypothetical protein